MSTATKTQSTSKVSRDVLLHGDVYHALDRLEDNSIAVAVTSPPYYKQRDYGFEGQIGQEKTPEEYIGRLVKVFSKLKSKLRDDGIFFLNVGDKYMNKYGKSHLLQIPYRIAWHMVKDGWKLIDIIIWYKPNHMPSSVKDRLTNTYEPVLVFAKSEENIYVKESNVLKVPLQQTPWKHTAVFPEKLIEELLRRTRLEDGDLVLDPFAGTGTVGAVVKKMRNSLFGKKVYSILIEKGDQFIDIIKKRVGNVEVIEVEGDRWEWEAVKEDPLPDVEPTIIANDPFGEVFIAKDSEEFLKALVGVKTPKFKSFHREDALFFFGVKKWDLRSLYYPHKLIEMGYVLRNMIVVHRNGTWFPIFMFVRDTKRVQYRFYLDRVRVRPKFDENRDWWKEDFVGMRVVDITKKSKKGIEGTVIKVLKRYNDGFPKLLAVKWGKEGSIELSIHPKMEEEIMEGVTFKCPRCGIVLNEFEPYGVNKCPSCGLRLFTSRETLPLIEEPELVKEVIKDLEDTEFHIGEKVVIRERKRSVSSKFAELNRINWGQSPGARKAVLGEYFTKMRLYRIPQYIVAMYLDVLRRDKGLTLNDVVRRMPRGYEHTVGHWFRKDFGGSIPLPEDAKLLKEVLGEHKIFEIISRTALKFQTVKASNKGKNPGDFLELDEEELISWLRKLYIPAKEYTAFIHTQPSS